MYYIIVALPEQERSSRYMVKYLYPAHQLEPLGITNTRTSVFFFAVNKRINCAARLCNGICAVGGATFQRSDHGSHQTFLSHLLFLAVERTG
jgi:hypothetical protein